jgi:hypothetical protein
MRICMHTYIHERSKSCSGILTINIVLILKLNHVNGRHVTSLKELLMVGNGMDSESAGALLIFEELELCSVVL